MRTREDRQSMKQRIDIKEAGKGPDFLGRAAKKLVSGAADFVSDAADVVSDFVNPTPTVTTTTTTPTTPTTPVVEDTPVVDPAQVELSRQRDEVMAGNVNSAQADYFREQNKDLFMKERKGTGLAKYNKLEKITGVNPVSNRKNDKMNELFGGLYGSEESRGF